MSLQGDEYLLKQWRYFKMKWNNLILATCMNSFSRRLVQFQFVMRQWSSPLHTFPVSHLIFLRFSFLIPTFLDWSGTLEDIYLNCNFVFKCDYLQSLYFQLLCLRFPIWFVANFRQEEQSRYLYLWLIFHLLKCIKLCSFPTLPFMKTNKIL